MSSDQRVYEVGGTLYGGTFSQQSLTKCYAVAGMTVAMNDGAGMKYLLTDHLGSVVAVTSSTGTLISQQRYMPFGAVREINNGHISETDFAYTGQRNLAGLGLMDYRARMYDPYLNRWTQPDTIVPSYAGPQTLNRYSYANNSPVLYTDPSGHLACVDENCSGNKYTIKADLWAHYRVHLQGNWSKRDQLGAILAVQATANMLAGTMHTDDSGKAFRDLYNTSTGDPLVIKKSSSYTVNGEKYTSGCVTWSSHSIECGSTDYHYIDSIAHNIVHELGHAFDSAEDLAPRNAVPQDYIDNRNTILHANNTGYWQLDEQHNNYETFADMFVAWIYGTWGPDADTSFGPQGGARDWMSVNMTSWVNGQ